MKLTDEQIIKAIEEWIKTIREDHQRMFAMCASIDCIDETYVEILVNTLDYINRLEAEKEKLVGTLELEKGKVKRLKEELKTVAVDQKIVKAFVIKDFVEKVVFEIVNKPSEFTAKQGTADFLSGSAHRQNEIIDIIEKMAVNCDE